MSTGVLFKAGSRAHHEHADESALPKREDFVREIERDATRSVSADSDQSRL